MSERLLVRGRWLVSGAGVDDAVLSDAAVVVEGDTIIEVGDWQSLHSLYRDAPVLGSDRVALIPGLVNAHHHSHAVSTVQHGLSDQLLEPWILGFAGLRSSSVHLNTLLSCATQLASGVTSVIDVHSNRATAREFDHTMRRALEAYAQSGMRVAFAAGVTKQSHIVHGAGEDQRFIDQLPARLRAAAAGLLPAADVIGDDDYLAVVESCWRDYSEHERIEVWFGPPGPQWVSDQLMQRIAERARALGTGIQTHVDESIYEMMQGRKFYRKPTVLHLRDLGVLSRRFSIAHGVWLNRDEIAAMAESGAGVSHNPSSNLRLRAGIAPLNALLDAGVATGLGMDGTSLNDDEDMFTEMRLAMRLHRTPLLGTPAPAPGEVLAMATTGGARLLGKEATLGRLAAGFKADIVVLDLQRVTAPWISPEADPRELLLMRARAGDVDTVLVGGEVVFDHGQPRHINVTAVGQALAEELAATPYPEAQARLVTELTPYLEAWYQRWEIPALEPYIRYNSQK